MRRAAQGFLLLSFVGALWGCRDDAPADKTPAPPEPEALDPEPAPEEPEPAPEDPSPEDPGPRCGDGACDPGEAGMCEPDCGVEPEPEPEQGPVCGDGACDPGEEVEGCPADCAECEVGQLECRGGRAFVCQGGAFVEGSCPEGSICVGASCAAVVCEANTARCVDERQIGICNSNGTVEDLYACPETTFCEAALCQSLCTPGTRSCRADDLVECQQDGRTQALVETCADTDGSVCSEGECVSGCEAFDVKGGYIGCDYWGVDTPNSFGLRNIFAFVISNVDDRATAHVIVEDRLGQVILEDDVPPLQVATLRMPHPRTMHAGGTGITDFGFRITTDVPINAYQFNPLQRFDNDMGVSVASNDASLMIPDTALGTEYIGVAFSHWSNFASFLSIVSTEDDNEVIIRPSAAVAAGGGVPQLAAGQEAVFTLNRGQVLTLKSLSAGTDLTGTEITSAYNVGVFGGQDCAQIPVGQNFCDHIEEKIFPIQAWDVEYFATKFQSRGVESDIWRIVASEDQTVITTDPPQISIPVLNRGEFFEFASVQDFKIQSDKPILVAQYMTGSSTTQSPDNGDPAMLLAVPARQFRRNYVFLVPDTYDDDWITITYPEGASPLLDGEPVNLDGSSPIGQSGFRVVRVHVEDGRHEVLSDLPVGVSVYGYDFNISYAYPAGLDLTSFRDGQD